ncbi:MAG: O-antigen ligase family protein [Acidobacteria bacterium]|nr:O-antigen ligase family protein [Acidobacteriota bacterium]
MIPAHRDPFAADQPSYNLATAVPLVAFYAGMAFLSSQVYFLPSWGIVLAPLALLAAILIAPIEYALGALACAFVAASATSLSGVFQSARWAFLLLAALVFSLRFFLRHRGGRGSPFTQFSYLMLLFWLLSAATMLTTVNLTFTALKLAALTGLFFIAARVGAHLVETHGPTSPRRFLYGLLAYSLAYIAVAAPSYLFGTSRQIAGALGNPNVWGTLVAFVLPWMICPLFRRYRHFAPSRLALSLAVLLVGYTMLLSGSRAALVGTLLALAVLSVVHADRRVAAVVLLGTLVITVESVAQPDLIPRLTRQYLYKYKGKDQVDLFRSRMGPWEASRRSFLENPWMGLGFGVTNRAEAQWSLDVRSVRAAETGSSFWGTLSQVGVLGSAPLFLAILLLLLRAGRFVWRVKDIWLTGVYGSTVALVVSAAFEGWLMAPGSFPCTYFWIQCFFLNAMMSRFQPAAVETASRSMSPPLESMAPAGR